MNQTRNMIKYLVPIVKHGDTVPLVIIEPSKHLRPVCFRHFLRRQLRILIDDNTTQETRV